MNKYLITGASGYIGSMLVRKLLGTAGGNENEITALVRNEEKARKMLPDTVRIVTADISDDGAVASLPSDFSYIIHCAAVTKSAEMQAYPVEVADGIVHGTGNILELTRRCTDAGCLKSMVYLSSMEVYGNIDCSDGHRVAEEEMGYVDPLAPRSCYPMGKRMAENLCALYYSEYGVPVKIARLAQTFGHGVPQEDTRVFAQFARAALTGENIILHTAGKSMGNYSAIEDTVSGILRIMQSGEDGQAYNVVNEMSTMRIRDMAELVARDIAGGRIQVVYDIPENNKYGYAADTGLMLSSKKLCALGWQPTKGLKQMYLDMMEDWKSSA